jgi:hypothetical protein
VRAFVHWVLAQRYRLIVLAIALAPLLPTVTAALVALETLARGQSTGTRSAGYVLLGTAALGLVSSANLGLVIGIAAVTVLAGVLIGTVLRSSDSLLLAFQAALLACLGAVSLVGWFGPGPGVLFGPMMDEAAELLRMRGATPDQIVAVQSWEGVLLGLMGALAFAQIVAAILLAYWWAGLESGRQALGEQFRRLRLGRVLGVPATVVIGFSLIMNTATIQNLAPVLLVAFAFQGLAIVHTWAYARRWHVAVLAVIYLLLITPLFGVLVLVMGLLGLIDNWFDLRAAVRPQR